MDIANDVSALDVETVAATIEENKLVERDNGSSMNGSEHISKGEENVFKKPIIQFSNPSSRKPDMQPTFEILKERTLHPIPYREPGWGGAPPSGEYSIEVLKSGRIIAQFPLSASMTVFGRSTGCDVRLEHPSVSRYHAILQWRSEKGSNSNEDVGFYIYELGSTHGTRINKDPLLAPRCYTRIRVGFVIKFGGSGRLYVVHGPDEDQEPISPYSVTELQKMKKLKQEAYLKAVEEKKKRIEEEKKREAAGTDWGQARDAEEEEDDNFVNPYAIHDDSLQLDDPKKSLRGCFEREGYDLEYETIEHSIGQYVCRVTLPMITDDVGKPAVAEVIHKGKKRDAQVEVALEACKMLNQQGILNASTHESKARRRKNWAEDDYYDSDDDSYLDRTGDIEIKRRKRMVRCGKSSEKAETYQSLTNKLKEIEEDLAAAKHTLAASDNKPSSCGELKEDSLESFMRTVKCGSSLDPATKKKLKQKIFELTNQRNYLTKLQKIAEPNTVSLSKPTSPTRMKIEPQPIQQQCPINVVEEDSDSEDDKQVTSEVPLTIPDSSVSNAQSTHSSISAILQQSRAHSAEIKPKKRKIEKHVLPQHPPSPPNLADSLPEEESEHFSGWIPPENQDGDGKTKLNELYGY